VGIPINVKSQRAPTENASKPDTAIGSHKPAKDAMDKETVVKTNSKIISRLKIYMAALAVKRHVIEINLTFTTNEAMTGASNWPEV
jgi:hypothetical protein